jgi:hypothetical protein
VVVEEAAVVNVVVEEVAVVKIVVEEKWLAIVVLFLSNMKTTIFKSIS